MPLNPHEQIREQATRLFGPDPRTWWWQCPACGHLASGRQYEEATGSLESAGSACLGRFVGGRSWPHAPGPGPCNYSPAGGLLPGVTEARGPLGLEAYYLPLAQPQKEEGVLGLDDPRKGLTVRLRNGGHYSLSGLRTTHCVYVLDDGPLGMHEPFAVLEAGLRQTYGAPLPPLPPGWLAQAQRRPVARRAYKKHGTGAAKGYACGHCEHAMPGNRWHAARTEFCARCGARHDRDAPTSHRTPLLPWEVAWLRRGGTLPSQELPKQPSAAGRCYGRSELYVNGEFVTTMFDVKITRSDPVEPVVSSERGLVGFAQTAVPAKVEFWRGK